MAYLVLVRHGQSTYNEKGIWTGWEDPPLTQKGIEESKQAGELIKNIHFDYGYVSDLKRTSESMDIIKEVTNQKNLPVFRGTQLKERNYGVYTGKDKWEVRKSLGEDAFVQLRRGWNYPVQDGESLKQVYDRVIPYFKNDMLPKLKNGQNLLVCSSGNALRAIVKYLDDISDAEISLVELATGEVYVYTIDNNGHVVKKEILDHRENTA